MMRLRLAVLVVLAVPACFCLTPGTGDRQGLLSNRPLVVIDADGGKWFGISDQLEGGAPIDLLQATSLEEGACYSELQIDQRFGARCAATELQTAVGPGDAPVQAGPAERAEANNARWYCNDEWIARVTLRACEQSTADPGPSDQDKPRPAPQPSAARFRILQIALRNQANLK